MIAYGLPNIMMFCAMLTAMVLVTLEYGYIVDSGGEPPLGLWSAQVEAVELVMRLSAGVLVLIMLWPVTACIFADVLGLRYLLPPNVLFTFAGAMAPALLIVLWSATHGAQATT